MWNVIDRRQERSAHPGSALEILMRSHRQRGELDIALLATPDGLLVASDGPRIVCEELAAYAPLLARGLGLRIDPRRIRGVTVHAFMVGRQELILLSRGSTEDPLRSALALSSIRGATRILRG